MDADIANVVYPLIGHGLSLRDRLEDGELLDIAFEQTTLREMLRSNAERQADVDDTNLPVVSADQSGLAATDPFLGFRYALVCWLDEMLGRYPNWLPGAWQDHSLEIAIYGSSAGPWKFWEQARLAEKQADDSPQVYYLCAMLGFRGELAHEMHQVRKWVEGVRARIGSAATVKAFDPPELDPVTDVAPLRGREKLQRIVMMAGSIFLVLVPVAAYLLVRRLGH